MANRLVRDVMTREIVTLPAETHLDEAAKAMLSRNIGDVVVTDGPALAGVVTDRDIVIRAIANNHNPFDTRLGDITSRHVVLIPETAPCSEAAEMMGEHGVRRLLVCDRDRRFVGVVSLGDLAPEIDANSALAEISEKPANT